MTETRTETNILEHTRDLLESLRPGAFAVVEQLEPLYAEDMRFQDPIQILEGRDAFLGMTRRLVNMSRKLQFSVTHACRDERTGILAWTMEFAPRLSPTLTIDGVSLLVIEDERIVMQRDYWDLLSALISTVPGASRLYRRLVAFLA